MVYLCGRPLQNRGRCTLGRETAIQPMVWGDDGWLRTTDGQGVPQSVTEAPALAPFLFTASPAREDFGAPGLPIDFQWLRTPYPDDLFSLSARPGHLRLYGRETIGSQFRQALVARRLQAHCASVSTVMDFEPRALSAVGGARVLLQQLEVSLLVRLTRRGARQACAGDVRTARSGAGGRFHAANRNRVEGPIELRAEIDFERLYLGYRVGGGAWQWIPQQFDASILSDEASAPGAPNFTGAFVGMACQDLAGTARPADFDWFEYREREFVVDPR